VFPLLDKGFNKIEKAISFQLLATSL
jgi:hypothetical protein